MTDDLYIGPSVLAPGAPQRPDHLARLLLIPLMVLFLALLLTFYIFFSVVRIDGDSMYPALLNEDRVLVTKGDQSPRRGDIVVFKALDKGREVRLVKRAVAIPGDTIEVDEGVALINGRPESGYDYVADPRFPFATGPTVVPEDTVFVLGDNRPVSLDSRMMGPIPVSAIQGKAIFRWAPIQRAGRLE